MVLPCGVFIEKQPVRSCKAVVDADPLLKGLQKDIRFPVGVRNLSVSLMNFPILSITFSLTLRRSTFLEHLYDEGNIFLHKYLIKSCLSLNCRVVLILSLDINFQLITSDVKSSLVSSEFPIYTLKKRLYRTVSICYPIQT